MTKTKEILKGVVLIVLIVVAHAILSTIGNVLYDLSQPELNMGQVDIRGFLLSSGVAYVLILMFSVRFFPNSQVYYIIGIGINIAFTCWSMSETGYPWWYYAEPLMAVVFMFSFNGIKMAK